MKGGEGGGSLTRMVRGRGITLSFQSVGQDNAEIRGRLRPSFFLNENRTRGKKKQQRLTIRNTWSLPPR